MSIKKGLSKNKRRLWWNNRYSTRIKKIRRKSFLPFEYLTAPENLNFDKHSKETLTYFDKLRFFNGKRFYIDLKKIRSISSSAAIALLSEIDNLAIRQNATLNVKDFNFWDKDIREQLRDMGMFQVLKINQRKTPNYIKKPHKTKTGIKYFHFRKQSGHDINKRVELLNDIQKFIRDTLSIENCIPERNELEVVISEAAANVANHAYELCNNMDDKLKYWWLSGSYEPVASILTIAFIDHGAGIPKMLKENWSDYVKSFLTAKTTDVLIIQKATEEGESSTKLGYRGKGLRAIKDFAGKTDNTSVRIISYRGDFMCSYGKKDVLRDFDTPLNGTLIEWKIKVS